MKHQKLSLVFPLRVKHADPLRTILEGQLCIFLLFRVTSFFTSIAILISQSCILKQRTSNLCPVRHEKVSIISFPEKIRQGENLYIVSYPREVLLDHMQGHAHLAPLSWK